MATNRFVLVKREVSRDFYQYFGLDTIGFRILNSLNEDMGTHLPHLHISAGKNSKEVGLDAKVG